MAPVQSQRPRRNHGSPRTGSRNRASRQVRATRRADHSTRRPVTRARRTHRPSWPSPAGPTMTRVGQEAGRGCRPRRCLERHRGVAAVPGFWRSTPYHPAGCVQRVVWTHHHSRGSALTDAARARRVRGNHGTKVLLVCSAIRLPVKGYAPTALENGAHMAEPRLAGSLTAAPARPGRVAGCVCGTGGAILIGTPGPWPGGCR